MSRHFSGWDQVAGKTVIKALQPRQGDLNDRPGRLEEDFQQQTDNELFWDQILKAQERKVRRGSLLGNSYTAARVSKDYTTWQQTTGLKGFHVDWRPRALRARVLFDISLKMNYYDEEIDMNHTANLTNSVRRQGPQSFLSCHQLLTYPQLRNIWEVH